MGDFFFLFLITLFLLPVLGVVGKFLILSWKQHLIQKRIQSRISAGEHPLMARAAEDGASLFAEARKRDEIMRKWLAEHPPQSGETSLSTSIGGCPPDVVSGENEKG